MKNGGDLLEILKTPENPFTWPSDVFFSLLITGYHKLHCFLYWIAMAWVGINWDAFSHFSKIDLQANFDFIGCEISIQRFR